MSLGVWPAGTRLEMNHMPVYPPRTSHVRECWKKEKSKLRSEEVVTSKSLHWSLTTILNSFR